MSGAARYCLCLVAISTASIVNTAALKMTVTTRTTSSASQSPAEASVSSVVASPTTSALPGNGVATSRDVPVRDQALVRAAKYIAETFTPRKYRAPLWARNPHFSTVFGSGELQKKLGNMGPQVTYRRERWDTPDGDFIDVDFLDTPFPGGSEAAGCDGDDTPFAVLTHGLESTSTAPLTARMALAFQRQGFRVAVLCFRGCSGEDNKTLRAYHLGFTDDLDLVCKTLRARHPDSGLFLSGFSLGGNVISKFLGELGERAWELGIMGAAVGCVPFDAVSCQERIDQGFSKEVYAKNFLKSLIPKALRMAERDPTFAKIVDLEKLQRATTIGEFDEIYVAPVFGFDGFQDYYRKTQSGQFLKGVRVPLLAVQARNDPFMNPDKLPTVDDLEGAPVRLSYHEHGGHCAFIVPDKQENAKGWLATELARFGRHVRQLGEDDA